MKTGRQFFFGARQGKMGLTPVADITIVLLELDYSKRWTLLA